MNRLFRRKCRPGDVFRDIEFDFFYDRNSGRVFNDLEFHQCKFNNCAISITRNPYRRSILRNIRFHNCVEIGCALEAAILEDILVDHFMTHDLFQTWAAVFKHVALRGKIGRIMISPLLAAGMASPEEQASFDAANAQFYSSIDWALDISNAQFEECDIRRIPAHLIRRDPETQVVIKREKALTSEWRKVDLSKTYWPAYIEGFLADGDDDVVLAAPIQHPEFRVLLEGLVRLRNEGIAEID